MTGGDMTIVYGFLVVMGLFVVVWFALVVPSERRDHERRLALIQKRIAEREQRLRDGDGEAFESGEQDERSA